MERRLAVSGATMRSEYSAIFLLQLLTSLNFLLSYASSGNSNGVCVSMGGRFPPLFKPWQTSQRREASEDCLQFWELLECSICDPQVGVQSGPPRICDSFCEKVYEACSNAYFSMDAKIQALTPCGVNDFVCGRVSEWISNGTELCHAAGFAVKPFDDIKETSCYGGKARLDAIADAWTPSRYKVPQQTENSGVLKDFQQWVRKMPFNEKVSWAVAGMVLTAGLLFTSRRKRRGLHHIQAAIQRNARIKKLDKKVKPRLPVDQANRMGSGR